MYSVLPQWKWCSCLTLAQHIAPCCVAKDQVWNPGGKRDSKSLRNQTSTTLSGDAAARSLQGPAGLAKGAPGAFPRPWAQGRLSPDSGVLPLAFLQLHVRVVVATQTPSHHRENDERDDDHADSATHRRPQDLDVGEWCWRHRGREDDAQHKYLHPHLHLHTTAHFIFHTGLWLGWLISV